MTQKEEKQQRLEKYKQIAPQYTQEELEEIFHVTGSSIRRYALETGIRYKPKCYSNHSIEWYENEFNKKYHDKLQLIGHLTRTKSGHIQGTCKCIKCGEQWNTNINAKLRYNTGCIKCDKGNHGNLYSFEEVEKLLNKNYESQWKLIEYNHYGKKDSIIECQFCKTQQTVKLSDFINTTTMRCTICQTGSFGEYVIANTLRYNDIPYQKEFHIHIDKKLYRMDFFIDKQFGLEYSGAQHFEKGLYYNEKINKGVERKKQWCLDHGYGFAELIASYDIDSIIADLSSALNIQLKRPTPEFFKSNNPDMQKTLAYMTTHSVRQTMKDLSVSITKVKKYVKLAGYNSISDWQSDNKVK